ncbi:hypothetical protein AB0383_16975 [Amycolatopsis sp. NPDC051373]|uniref:hypothetical protein n=1 Tax=Amycolatopsis sp. NPDC051373 TaxID=3155801 RepID=UPI00344EB63E
MQDAIARHVQQPNTTFECIVDSPTLANWRLCPHRDTPTPTRVRLALFSFAPTQADSEREQRVNQALDRLPA